MSGFAGMCVCVCVCVCVYVCVCMCVTPKRPLGHTQGRMRHAQTKNTLERAREQARNTNTPSSLHSLKNELPHSLTLTQRRMLDEHHTEFSVLLDR
jgi:hypothetical protein